MHSVFVGGTVLQGMRPSARILNGRPPDTVFVYTGSQNPDICARKVQRDTPERCRGCQKGAESKISSWPHDATTEISVIEEEKEEDTEENLNNSMQQHVAIAHSDAENA